VSSSLSHTHFKSRFGDVAVCTRKQPKRKEQMMTQSVMGYLNYADDEDDDDDDVLKKKKKKKKKQNL
jgi:hypothetical protein